MMVCSLREGRKKSQKGIPYHGGGGGDATFCKEIGKCRDLLAERDAHIRRRQKRGGRRGKRKNNIEGEKKKKCLVWSDEKGAVPRVRQYAGKGEKKKKESFPRR